MRRLLYALLILASAALSYGQGYSATGGSFSGTATTLVGTTSVAGGGAVDAANACWITANTYTCEGATANAFETLIVAGDATADASLTLTATSAGVGATGFGNITVGNGTASSPAIFIDSVNADWQIQSALASLRFLNNAGTLYQSISAASLLAKDTGQVAFGSNPEAPDAGIGRAAASIVQPTNGSSGVGWIYEQGASAALAADYTNATAVMSNISGLTRTLLTGRKYVFDMYLRFSNSTAADGIVIDFDGGTATATDFRAHCLAHDTALLLSAQTAALATDVSITTATGASLLECHGSLTVNAAGTFIPRAQEEADGGGTLTIELGSDLRLHDVPFN